MTDRRRRSKTRESRTKHAQPAAPYITRRIGTMNVLSAEGLELIESNADQILAETGMEFRDDPEILDIFAAAGCDIDGERARFFPGSGRAVLKVIHEEETQKNARIVGAALLECLRELQSRHEAIGDVRGRGLMLAIEMVKDRKTKEPDRETTSTVFERCREQDLILSKSGPSQSCLRMVPPMCLSLDDVDQVADGLDAAFTKGV